jgi:TM2 domain-containing membrane protein YozV
MKRTDDPNVIEHRLLELAYTTDAPITSPALAYFAPCSLDDAERVLDRLVTRDRIQMEVGDDGSITYVIPNRYKLKPRSEPVPPTQLVRRPDEPFAIRGGRSASPLLAAGLSLLVPGAGQIYTGKVMSAILWFLLVTLGYTVILPGIFLHLFCIAAAASSAHRLNSSLTRLQLET